jgi:hypothetical protein
MTTPPPGPPEGGAKHRQVHAFRLYKFSRSTAALQAVKAGPGMADPLRREPIRRAVREGWSASLTRGGHCPPGPSVRRRGVHGRHALGLPRPAHAGGRPASRAAAEGDAAMAGLHCAGCGCADRAPTIVVDRSQEPPEPPLKATFDWHPDGRPALLCPGCNGGTVAGQVAAHGVTPRRSGSERRRWRIAARRPPECGGSASSDGEKHRPPLQDTHDHKGSCQDARPRRG